MTGVPTDASGNLAAEGNELLKQQNYRAAADVFRNALRLDPDCAQFHTGLGRALLRQGLYDAAAAQFGEAVELRSDDAESFAGLGEARLKQQRLAEAEDAYRKAISLDGDRAEYYAGLGEALVSQDQYRLGEDAFRRAAELEPANPDYSAGQERARLGRERYEAPAKAKVTGRDEPEAETSDRAGRDWIRQRREYVNLDQKGQPAEPRIDTDELSLEFALGQGDDAASLASAARAFVDDGRHTEAESVFREAIELAPSRADYRADLGNVLMAQRRYRDAAQEFRAAADLAPNRGDYLAALGRARLAQGRYEEAGSAFTEALQSDPDRPEYLYLLGEARLRENRISDAEVSFRRASDLRADFADALDGLGRSLLAQQRYADAEDNFQRAARAQPGAAEHLGGLGQALLAQQRPGEAEAVFRKAIDMRPDQADYRAGLGEALLSQDQYLEAERAFTEAVALQPTNAYYHAGIGHSCAARQEYDAAEKEFRSAISLDPASRIYRASLGKALLCQERMDDVQAVLDELASIDPGSSETVELRNAISETFDAKVLAYIREHAKKALEGPRPEVSTVQPERYLRFVENLSLQNISAVRDPFRAWQAAKGSERRKLFGLWSYPSPMSMRGRTLTLTLLVLISAVAASGSLLIANSYMEQFLLPSVPVAAGSAVLLAEYLRGSRRDRLRLALIASERARLDTLIDGIILEPALTAALGAVWRDAAEDVVAVADGPELCTKAEPDNIIPTEAFTRLAKSLARAHGAAVGIAGPRGSGKTELARAFTELGLHSKATRTIPLMLWAPVKYDAQTFLLRLLKELCINIISVSCGTSMSKAPIFAHRRVRITLIFVGAFCLVVAGVFLIVDKAEGLDFRPFLPYLAGSALIVGGFMASVIAWSLRTGRSALHIRSGTLSWKTVDLANELRSRVEFTETYTSGSTIGVSGKTVNASSTTGLQLARIPLNEIDVVRELRNIVEAVAADDWQVVIAIDELDKISDEKEAAEFLNHIKVLFPIRECSFIVSVSQNAWSLFECRGLPLRDAFDSSFDEIILIDMLKPEESRDLLKRRSRDVTDAQALFCHCLSGGLPRDLLRAVRFLARIASSLKETGRASSPSLSDVLGELFNEELMAKVTAIRHSTPKEPDDLREFDHQELIVWIDSQSTRDQARAEPDADTVRAYASFLYTLRAAFAAGGPLSNFDSAQGFHESSITEGFDLIAKARRSLAGDVPGAYLALEEARKTLGIADSVLTG